MTITAHPHIKAMSPYKPPLEGRSSSPYLLLDFNERTTPLPEIVIEKIADWIRENRLHKYPEYGDIEQLIAQYAEVPNERVMITNGSDQGIDVIFRAFTTMGDEVIVPAPTFAMHEHSAHLQGCELIAPVYTREGGYPLDDVLTAISPRTKLIVVCNPNGPTGTLLEVDGIARIAAAAPNAVVLIDECYFEYAGVTAKDIVSTYPNIIITRTFSKTWGLSSLRLGYVIAVPEVLEELLKVRGPYDVNMVAVEALRAAMAQREYLDEYVKEVMEVALPRFENFLRAEGIAFWPSRANFILIHPPDAAALEERLRTNDILVRPRKGPGINNTVRITIGTVAQMERVMAVMKTFLAEGGR